MREADLPAVLAIEALSLLQSLERQHLPRGDPEHVHFVPPGRRPAKPGDEVVGYIIYWHIRDDVQVNNVAVHPDFRGRGIGEALMRHAIEKVRGERAPRS